MIKWIVNMFRRPRPKPAAAATAVACVITASAALIAPWEGRELRSYRDIVGVWTICYGHTETAGPNQVKTPAECDSLLAQDVKKYNGWLREQVGRPMPHDVEVALTSWIYNVGPTASRRSTLVRHAKAGQWVEACNQLPRWNKAGGKEVRGLTRRRAAEQELCLKGAKQ